MKTPLILISGLLSNERLWAHQTEHLKDIATIKVISPTQETPEKMIESILNQAPDHFALAGHSMGGWLCLEIMRNAPSRVSKLCLLNTTSRPDTPKKKKKRKQMIRMAENGQFLELAEKSSEFFVFNSTVKEEIKKMFLNSGKTTFIQQEKSMLIRDESQSILPLIKCPTLVIHASKDKVFSLDEHLELMQNISGARLAIIEDSGHMSPMEMPQAVTAILRYWLTYF